MAKVNLYNGQEVIDTSLDNIVIVKMLECSPAGGRSLDVEGFSLPVIKAGHVIIRDKQNNKEYKPMPVHSDGTKYDSLPSEHEIVGVAYSSALTKKAFMTIMVRGTVNEVASPFPVTKEIKDALPLIRFTQD